MNSNIVADPDVQRLVETGIDELTRRNSAGAAEKLAEAIRREPNNEKAWLWLSGIVEGEDQQLYCLERVLRINPASEVARGGLSILNSSKEPHPPRVSTTQAKVCTFPGCSHPLVRSHHFYCRGHWEACQESKIPVPALSPSAAWLTATEIGQRRGLTSHRVNLILSELGWIQKAKKGGYAPTPHGAALGAKERVFVQTGKSYVEWPAGILINKALETTLHEFAGQGDASASSAPLSHFRDRIQGEYHAADGHIVKSRAELAIDNWLYMAEIAHAYERRLPIEEEAYCDFYIPSGKVYIEYWGIEDSDKYLERMKVKKQLYEKYNLSLIGIGDTELKVLDDLLPKELIKYGVTVD